MEFSAWSLFTDLGLISLLLVVGMVLRAKVKFIQKLFLPASIIAGILGLALGPNGLGWIPFSDAIGDYPGILIAVIFGSLPLTSPKINWAVIRDRVGGMWAYSQIVMILMWGAGLGFALLLINPFFGELNAGFGLLLAAGFVGGHGTAAAIGETFANSGWEEATSLAMTSATVGVICSILIGILLIKRGSSKGEASFLTSFDSLSNELRTGLIPKDKRESTEMNTVSSIAVEPFIIHLALVFVIAMSGYYLSQWGEALFNDVVAIPAFSLAFLVGLVVKKLLEVTKAMNYVSKDVVSSVSGSATDLLVAFGIASISIAVVIDYAIPLLLLFAFGLLFSYVYFKFVAKHFFGTYSFEKGIFTWGWSTGTVAMGIALLRIVDPDSKSKTLDDYGLAYIPIAPVEILLITFAPVLVISGNGFLFVGITIVITLAIYILARASKWLNPSVYKK